MGKKHGHRVLPILFFAICGLTFPILFRSSAANCQEETPKMKMHYICESTNYVAMMAAASASEAEAEFRSRMQEGEEFVGARTVEEFMAAKGGVGLSDRQRNMRHVLAGRASKLAHRLSEKLVEECVIHAGCSCPDPDVPWTRYVFQDGSTLTVAMGMEGAGFQTKGAAN
jgi:hypothetical protein